MLDGDFIRLVGAILTPDFLRQILYPYFALFFLVTVPAVIWEVLR